MDGVGTGRPTAGRRSDLPTGTVTLLFTDIEGSTRLLQQLGDAYGAVLEAHHALLRDSLARFGGHEVDTAGDSFFIAFERPGQALAAAADAQRSLSEAEWPAPCELRVRMGIHTGTVQVSTTGYVGTAVHRAARIMAAGHGGQVLVSGATAALAADDLPAGMSLSDLGEHRVKDFEEPVRLFQLVHPDLGRDFPALVTLDLRPHNLPFQVGSFVGRESELEAIDGFLSGGHRLLTLVGPGGTGKTRLAIRAAADQLDRLRDGAFFVDLAAATDAESAVAAIARVIGAQQSREQSLLDEVKRRLRDRQLLLVLDNFEQLISAAPTVTELLEACPAVEIIVTSREALHLRGEQLLPVPAMSMPAPDAGPPPFASEVSRFEAIQLFVERARAVRPDFNLTDDNAAAVADICRRLDGLPLAIELATARLNLFSAEVLRDRLESRLRGAGRGARDLPERQQTLHNTIDWSYRLLDTEERRLFDLLSVFGHIATDAVEAVMDALDPATRPGLDAIEGLESLLGKSLVRRDADGSVMLETIREFAAARLAEQPDVEAAAREAHATAFAAIALDHTAGDGRGHGHDLEPTATVRETENFESAWTFLVEAGDVARLDDVFSALGHVYQSTGRYRALIAITDDLLGVLRRTPASDDRDLHEVILRTGKARALLALVGYTPEVEAAYNEALTPLAGKQGRPQSHPVLRDLMRFYMASLRFEETRDTALELLRLADATDDDGMRLDGLVILAMWHLSNGDLVTSAAHLERGIDAFERQGVRPRRFAVGTDPRISTLTSSAFVELLLGAPDTALARAERAIELAGELGPYNRVFALFHCAFLHLWRLEPDRVHERATALLALAEQHAYPVWRAAGTALLGASKVLLGRADEGIAEVEAGMADFRSMRSPPIFWRPLRFVQAIALAVAGRPSEALVVVDELLEVSADRSLSPALHLLRGDLLVGAEDVEGAVREWTTARDEATAVLARSPLLQAETRLLGARRAQGIADDGSGLRAVFDTFTEGLSTPDLAAARALLEPADPPTA